MDWLPLYNKNTNFILSKIHKIKKQIKNFPSDISLFGGKTGSILFQIYYSNEFQDEKYYDETLSDIQFIFDKIAFSNPVGSLSGGLAGIGLVIEHLKQNAYLKCNTNEIIGELDGFLYKKMIEDLNKNNYDYLHGASGIALYFLNRKELPETKGYLAEYVDLLEKTGEKEGYKYKWLSNIAIDGKKVVYNLSLSHGISSLIIILAKICSLGINQEKSFKLLNGAVNYLLANEQDFFNVGSHFPNWISKNSNIQKSRLAWCYGDLGIGIALWLAGKNANNTKWQNKALEILLHTTQRKDLKEDFVLDAGLCHGTAGNAHIYNRMFNYTQREEFKQAALYWFDQTFKMAKFEDGLAGYKTWRSVEYGGWQNDYGLLTGITGIGLAFISAVSDIEPAWDECLLLS
ncbi:MAG: lanthionine synthetase C family protein [Thiohalospira sp.]